MSDQISTAFVKEFGNTVDLLSQQKGTRLRRTIGRVEQVNGEFHFFEQIDKTSAVRTNTRHGDSPLIETPHARVRVSMENVEWGDLVDNFDRVRTLIDPTDPMTRNAGFAVGREIDDIIIEALFADMNTGKDGGTTSSLPAAQTISADFDGDGTKEGLTVPKLREARKILKANEALGDMPLWCVFSAEQEDDLLGSTEVTSADFNTVRTLVNGDVDTFLGAEYVGSERLQTDSSSDRRVPFYVSEAMGLAVGAEPQVNIAPRPDKKFSLYIYWATVVGATRLENDKMVEILCKE